MIPDVSYADRRSEILVNFLVLSMGSLYVFGIGR